MKKTLKLINCIWIMAGLIMAAGCGRMEQNPVAEPLQEVTEAARVPVPMLLPAPTVNPVAYLNGEWEQDLPENHGIEPSWLEEFANELQDKQICAALLIKDGRIVYESYMKEYNKDSQFNLYSCTKSVTSAAVGVAIEQGYLTGVDCQIGDYFPNIENDQMKKITIEQLLNFTSGIDWSESSADGDFVDWMMAENQVDYMLNKNMKHEPGEVFNYSTGSSHLISAILTQATGMTEEEYVKRNIFEPIGIHDYAWWADAQGITFGGLGIWMTARDAARFGQLYLNEGKWGEQQVVPAQWVRTSTSKQGPNEDYGYNWWVDVPHEQQKYSMYNAAGYGGQYIFVVPKFQIVAVVTSRGVEDSSVVTAFKELLDKLE